MNELARRGVCLVIAGPAGTGKSTILRHLVAEDPELAMSVSATTRAPRPGERDGEHYHFTDRAGFDAMVAAGEMLEHATVHGRSYGTPRGPVLAALSAGRDVGFDIDWQGHLLLRTALPGDVVSVFVLPPSMEALRERMLSRAGDTAEEIERRMRTALDEIAHYGEFDHVMVNSDLERATDSVRSMLRAARSRRERQTGLPAFVARLLGR